MSFYSCLLIILFNAVYPRTESSWSFLITNNLEGYKCPAVLPCSVSHKPQHHKNLSYSDKRTFYSIMCHIAKIEHLCPTCKKTLLEEFYTELCGKGRDGGRCAIANTSFSTQWQFTSSTGCFDCSTKDKGWTWYKVCADMTACCFEYNCNLFFNACFPTRGASSALNRNTLSGIKVKLVSILRRVFPPKAI